MTATVALGHTGANVMHTMEWATHSTLIAGFDDCIICGQGLGIDWGRTSDKNDHQSHLVQFGITLTLSTVLLFSPYRSRGSVYSVHWRVRSRKDGEHEEGDPVFGLYGSIKAQGIGIGKYRGTLESMYPIKHSIGLGIEH